MKYEKTKEHKRVAQTMTFLDRFGNEIPGAISWDSETGIAVVYEAEDGHGPMVKRAFLKTNT